MTGERHAYLRRETQLAARWVRDVVGQTGPGRQPECHELDTLEFALINYIRNVAEHEQRVFGKDRHVSSGEVLSLIFKRFYRRLGTIAYVGVREGEAFGKLRDGASWTKRLDHAEATR